MAIKGYFDFKDDRRHQAPVTTKPSNAQQTQMAKRGEVKGGLLGLLQSLGSLNIPTPGMEQVQSGLQAIPELPGQAVDALRGAGINQGNVERGFGKLVAGNPQFLADGDEEAEGVDPRNQAPSPEFIERMAQKQAADTFQQIEDLNMLAEENLSPEGRAIYEKFRAEKEQELADLNNQIANLNQQGALQQEYASEITAQAFPEGLIPGSDPEATRQLNELLDVAVEGGTGGTAPELQAIIDSIIDSNLPEDEKLERLGWVTDQAQMRSELQGAIDSLVTDREATQELLALPMSEVLNDPSLFTQTQLNVDAQFDSFGRTAIAVLEEVEGVLEQQFGGTIPPEMAMTLTNEEGSGILDLVALGRLDPNSEQFIQRVQMDMPGVNPALVQSAVNQGLEIAAIRHDAFDNALDQSQYTAGSIELVYALFQSALGAGFDEQTAGMIAESENIHHIIDVYSDGVVGAQGTGGRQGLGMLTPEAYERLGLPMDGTAESELMALIMYMMEPGNPAIRMQTFFDTGVWGN